MMGYRLVFGAALAALTAGAAAAAPAVTQDELELHRGPGPGFAVIRVIPAGVAINAGSCSAGWCRAAFDGTAGFVERDQLAFGAGLAPRYANGIYSYPNATYYDDGYAYNDGYGYDDGYYAPGGVGVTVQPGYRRYGDYRYDRRWDRRNRSTASVSVTTQHNRRAAIHRSDRHANTGAMTSDRNRVQAQPSANAPAANAQVNTPARIGATPTAKGGGSTTGAAPARRAAPVGGAAPAGNAAPVQKPQ